MLAIVAHVERSRHRPCDAKWPIVFHHIQVNHAAHAAGADVSENGVNGVAGFEVSFLQVSDSLFAVGVLRGCASYLSGVAYHVGKRSRATKVSGGVPGHPCCPISPPRGTPSQRPLDADATSGRGGGATQERTTLTVCHNGKTGQRYFPAPPCAIGAVALILSDWFVV